MKRELSSSIRPAQHALAHWAVSAVALAAVIAVQMDWNSLINQAASDRRPVFFGAVIVVVTAWLLTTAWLHGSIAGGRRGTTTGRLRLQAVADLAIAAVTVVVLFQGHRSRLANAGFWAIGPALLAVSIPSALVFAQAAVANQPRGFAIPQVRLDWLRIVISAALLALFVWIAAATVWRVP